MGEAARPIKNWATFFADGLVFLDAEPASPANDTAPPAPITAKDVPRFKWIHCATEGNYKGHHQGAFDFTPEVLATFVKNFRASPQYKPGKLELGGQAITVGTEPVIQFDYEHASEMPPWEGTIPESGAPAPAWAVDVATRLADGKVQLWALADLGEAIDSTSIRHYIATRKYRWVSIAFTLAARHWITADPIGPLLTSIAFTNHPYMQDLEPLAAANRVTSQPARGVARSASESSGAHDGTQSSRTGGARMDDKLRERICHALKIQTLANDEQVGAAVEESAGAGSKLQSLVSALGEVDYAAAMKVVPELKTARDNAKSLLDELNGLLGQAQAADAAIAPIDVGAAMRACNYKGTGAETALLAHRKSLIETEVSTIEKAKKPGERLSAAELATAREAGRQAFLKAHGVSDQAHAHLGTSLVAGPHGVQLSPPVTGKPLTLTDTNGSAATIDLRGLVGLTVIDRMCTHLRKAEPGFDKLPWVRQVERASNVLQSDTPVIAE
jgi:hypothetical protein